MIGSAEELAAYLRGDPAARQRVERPEDVGQDFLSYMRSIKPQSPSSTPVEPAQESDK